VSIIIIRVEALVSNFFRVSDFWAMMGKVNLVYCAVKMPPNISFFAHVNKEKKTLLTYSRTAVARISSEDILHDEDWF
jgi:hypothetical protein